VIEFHYRPWAACGLGSSVTFADAEGIMEVTATLLERDEEKVVLAIRCTVGQWSLDFAETLRPRLSPDGRSLRERHEIIVVAGEEWLSRRIETFVPYFGRNVTVTSWIVDQVPGGMARWQLRERDGEPEPLTWFVTSFVRK
jgi:hypothetical protein